MASQLFVFLLILFLSFSPLTFSITIEEEEEQQQYADNFVCPLDRKLLDLKTEKLSHFRFYWHDTLGGSKPSSVFILPPLKNHLDTHFGMLDIFDNPLTEGPELTSKEIGRSQGIYASASQSEVALLMIENFAFIGGKYNGSTVTVLGRNLAFTEKREMPIVGGSGLFRFARGYCEARTHFYDPDTKDATVEYNMYVMHY